MDTVTGATATFNPLLVPDNAEYGAGGTVAGSAGCSTPNPICGPGAYGAQNSEPASLLAVLGDPFYNMNINDTYFDMLTIFDLTGATIVSESIVVNAGTGASVPEPASLALFGAGIAGLATIRRKKKARA